MLSSFPVLLALALPQSAPKPAAPVQPIARPEGGAPALPPADRKPVGGDAPQEGEIEFTPEQKEARTLGAEALTLFKAGQIEKALPIAQKAFGLDPKYEIAARVLGWCAVATGDHRKAEEVLTKALNLAPQDAELQYLLATCHRRLEEWGAAKDLLADLLQRNGPNLRVLLEMSECCIGEEDWPGALAVLENARQLDPKERRVVDQIVEVHEKSEEWDKAAAELKKLIVQFPKEVPLRYRLVQQYLSATKLQEAADGLEELAKVALDDPKPHQLLETMYSGPLPDDNRLEHHRNWLKDWQLRRR